MSLDVEFRTSWISKKWRDQAKGMEAPIACIAEQQLFFIARVLKDFLK